MRIYTKVVIDMKTGETLEEESFEYSGPVALCGGGGDAPSGAPDFYYEHLVGAGEQEMQLAQELMNFYKWGSFSGPPRDISAITTKGKNAMSLEDMVATGGSGSSVKFSTGIGGDPMLNYDLNLDIPGMGSVTRYQHPENQWQTTTDPKEAQKWLDEYNAKHGQEVYVTPDGKEFTNYEEAAEYAYQQGFAEPPTSYASMEKAQIEANMELIPLQTGLEKSNIELQQLLNQQAMQTAPLAGETERMRLQQQQNIMQQQAPLLQQYFNEAGNVDPNAWANRAQADVAQQFGTARKQLRSNIMRTGAMPGSGRMSAIQADLATEQAKATAGARTTARRDAQRERFARLGQAIQIG